LARCALATAESQVALTDRTDFLELRRGKSALNVVAVHDEKPPAFVWTNAAEDVLASRHHVRYGCRPTLCRAPGKVISGTKLRLLLLFDVIFVTFVTSLACSLG